MSNRGDLARSAVTEALRLRSRNGRKGDQPICPIDLALEAGLDVRFESISSLEGMYVPDGPCIILGALRPRGRRAYTCAHELGHHVFGHGVRFDEILATASRVACKDDAEYVADRFAAALLMPKLAVLQAFVVRRWDIATCNPEQLLTIAGVLGVGYTTLLGYLEGTLRAIDSSTAAGLRKSSPKAIRSRLLGTQDPPGLVMVDEFWSGRPVDAEVGDFLAVPAGASVNGDIVERASEQLLFAKAPGTTRLQCGPWHAQLRIMRAGYTGLAAYRHLEEADDDS